MEHTTKATIKLSVSGMIHINSYKRDIDINRSDLLLYKEIDKRALMSELSPDEVNRLNRGEQIYTAIDQCWLWSPENEL